MLRKKTARELKTTIKVEHFFPRQDLISNGSDDNKNRRHHLKSCLDAYLNLISSSQVFLLLLSYPRKKVEGDDLMGKSSSPNKIRQYLEIDNNKNFRHSLEPNFAVHVVLFPQHQAREKNAEDFD